MNSINGMSNVSLNNYISNVDNNADAGKVKADSSKAANQASSAIVKDSDSDSYVTVNRNIGDSKRLDPDYYKNFGAIKNDNIQKSDLGGYDVSTDGSTVHARSHGGQVVSDFITGNDYLSSWTNMTADDEIHEFNDRWIGGDMSVKVSNEMVGFDLTGSNFSLGGRIFHGDAMGNLSSDLLNIGYHSKYGSINLTGGLVGDNGMVALGGHFNNDLYNKSFNNGLSVGANVDSKFALPFIFSDKASFKNNFEASSLFSTSIEYDVTKNLALGARYNINVDLANAIAGGKPISDFAEFSANYHANTWNAAANIYIPLDINDEAFSGKATWNVQASKVWAPGLVGVYASVSGNFDSSPVSKVEAGFDFNSLLSTGVSVSNIDTGNANWGFYAKVDALLLWGATAVIFNH